MAKQHVFCYFSTTTGWNHSRFSALATIYSMLTEKRQANSCRFQMMSQKDFTLHFFALWDKNQKYAFSPRNTYYTALGLHELFHQQCYCFLKRIIGNWGCFRLYFCFFLLQIRSIASSTKASYKWKNYNTNAATN